jgi:hypothetical protein
MPLAVLSGPASFVMSILLGDWLGSTSKVIFDSFGPGKVILLAWITR